MALTVGRKPFTLKDFQEAVSNQYVCFKLFTVELKWWCEEQCTDQDLITTWCQVCHYEYWYALQVGWKCE